MILLFFAYGAPPDILVFLAYGSRFWSCLLTVAPKILVFFAYGEKI